MGLVYYEPYYYAKLPETRDWKDLKKEVDVETEKIRLEPPIEVLRLAHGILRYKPGHHNQSFTVYNTVFGIFFGLFESTWRCITQFIKDETFTFEQCKKIVANHWFREHAYLQQNFSEKYFCLIEELRKALPTVQNKDELFELCDSFHEYQVQTWRWLSFYMPVGNGEKQNIKTKENIEELAKLAEGAYKV